MRIVNIAIVAAVLVIGLGGCSLIGPRYVAKTKATQSAAHVEQAGLKIQATNGTVEVIADSKLAAVEILTELQCSGNTQAEADQRLAGSRVVIERDMNRLLTIKGVFAGGVQGNDGLSVQVRVPSTDGATIDTSNGAVIVKGLTGRLVINTSNAVVDIQDHTGDVTAITSNGPVVTSNITGRVKVESSNAVITAKDQSGPITADTSNGPIVVSLRDDQNGPVHLSSSNGSIDLTVGPAFHGEVRASTSNGGCTLTDHAGTCAVKEIDDDALHAVLGDGGETSVLDTSNGSVTVTIQGKK